MKKPIKKILYWFTRFHSKSINSFIYIFTIIHVNIFKSSLKSFSNEWIKAVGNVWHQHLTRPSMVRVNRLAWTSLQCIPLEMKNWMNKSIFQSIVIGPSPSNLRCGNLWMISMGIVRFDLFEKHPRLIIWEEAI